jgi:hypothetical protein
MLERYFHRKRPVDALEGRDEAVRDHARTTQIPVPEKIENAVKKTMEKITDGKIIHDFIVARYIIPRPELIF